MCYFLLFLLQMLLCSLLLRLSRPQNQVKEIVWGQTAHSATNKLQPLTNFSTWHLQWIFTPWHSQLFNLWYFLFVQYSLKKYALVFVPPKQSWSSKIVFPYYSDFGHRTKYFLPKLGVGNMNKILYVLFLYCSIPVCDITHFLENQLRHCQLIIPRHRNTVCFG